MREPPTMYWPTRGDCVDDCALMFNQLHEHSFSAIVVKFFDDFATEQEPLARVAGDWRH